MGRLKLFLENMLVYGLGGIISKIIPLLMLPIITRLMPDIFYFGLNDISNLIVSFGSAIALMGMYDAMFRLFFDKEDIDYKQAICSTALFFTIFMSSVVFILLYLFRRCLSNVFFGDAGYINLLTLTAISILVGTTNSIMSAPLRMQNKRKVYLITNTLSPILAYAVSIPLLKQGYFIVALPMANAVSALSMELIFFALNKKWFSIRKWNWQLLKQLLTLGLPVMPSFLMYWIFNSCDRLMISQMLGMDHNGIYAIGAKLGQISQLIYTAFAGGWQYFAFSTMGDRDQVDMTSKIFEYLGAISFAAGILMAAFSKSIFLLLFKGEYIQGYKLAPYLFFAPLLLMLYQIAANQFLVIKKTSYSLVILSMGALVNIAVNYLLIKVCGVEGAALGTLAGYLVIVLLSIWILRRMNLLIVYTRFWIGFFIFIVYLLLWRFWFKDYIIPATAFAVICLIFYLIIFGKPLCRLVKQVLIKKQNER